jgi:glycosyltransferase involved in cell wall biosynthesis
MLRRALESLTVLRNENDHRIEIVVVNNASTDDTDQVITEAARGAPVPIRGVYEARPGVSAARNRGVKEARGEWIAFADDDELPAPDWLSELLSFAQQRDLLWVGGLVRVVLDEAGYPAAPNVHQCLLGRQRPFTVPLPFSHKRLPGTDNVLIHRRIFDKIGLFNEALVDGEDHELFSRALAAGFEGWCTPAAVVDHLAPSYRMSPSYLRWRYLRYGKNRAKFDHQELSWPVQKLALVARFGQAVFRHVPVLMLAKLLRKEGVLLETRCLLWRFEAYLRYSLRQMMPWLFPQREFFDYLDFRSERELFSGSPPPAPGASARTSV